MTSVLYRLTAVTLERSDPVLLTAAVDPSVGAELGEPVDVSVVRALAEVLSTVVVSPLSFVVWELSEVTVADVDTSEPVA